MIKLSDLRVRDVVNIVDGKRLGVLCDVEVDLAGGRITALVVPGQSRMFGLLGHDRDLVIPWGDIVKIGEDVILVNLSRPPAAGGDAHPAAESHRGAGAFIPEGLFNNSAARGAGTSAGGAAAGPAAGPFAPRGEASR